MKDFEDLPLDADCVLNNISHLIGAARVLDGTSTYRELGISIIEFVDAYVAAAIEEMKMGMKE
ncbi:hypothetical protein [Klebsiella pneumoniae]|jgi:hypothetical protein|uniref:hypothetical protein n=1 Tax=Klebsiella TaxID=570 RepID=UPI000342250F|nr:hypothetical protein [Klebsiella pneumoniae]EOY64682.1 hypothetical protein H253_5551 [Klebsiella pneumoniae KP-7]EOZ73969.1 hypothetical protein H254_4477 [Klebsiella pneumoniae KP-11]MBG1842488.1 hypothetical protein [Klebsiella pneumoniae]MCZ9587014.1 hypothetical protein [Klebsiella pneumoniae]HBT2197777.1 hypothetical protein [Klebsiella pneumoniae]